MLDFREDKVKHGCRRMDAGVPYLQWGRRNGVGGERRKNQEGTDVIVTVDLDIGGRGVRVIMVEFALGRAYESEEPCFRSRSHVKQLH